MKLVFMQNNQAITDSRTVAETFDKNHKDVLESIREILAAENSATRFFYESTFENRGKFYPMYLMNRDGFSLLAMGFTGKKALKFKLKFINAFNKMEAALGKLNKKELDRQQIRRNGIDNGRFPLTDAVQQFNLRDFSDGDKNPQARKRYGRLTAESQINIFGIPAGGRDVATGHELSMLYLGEQLMTTTLNKAFSHGESFNTAEIRAIKNAAQLLRIFNGEISLFTV